jgi:hypothetical protein
LLSPIKIPDGYQMVIPVKSFLKVSISTRRVFPSVNRPCGVWSPEEKIKNSFRYAIIIVVSLVVTIFDI